MLACAYGHKDVVQLLLEHSKKNIDFNAKSNGRVTAFMWACIIGQKDVVKLLIECSEAKGIDVICGQEKLSNEMKVFIDMHQEPHHKMRGGD